MFEYFGFNDKTKVLGMNGDKDGKEEPWEDLDVPKEEATVYRGHVARLIFYSQDCPDL